MKTVVTGGAGFIGSNLVRKLLDDGREVFIADDFSRGTVNNLYNLGIKPEDVGCKASFPVYNLLDYNNALEVTNGAETVFHLAANIGNIECLHGSNMNEFHAMTTNVTIDANVFKACVENGVNKIVYASSAAVYPIDKQNLSYEVVMAEDFLTTYNPDGGYGWAKLMGEIELALMTGMDIGIARIFNVFGINSYIGKNPHAVIEIMRKAIQYPENTFVVWGDGKQTRDFLHVSDCVDALIKLEEKAANPPLIVNIGSGKATSIQTLAEEIIRISSKDIKVRYDNDKPVGPLSRTADIKRAKNAIGWEPKTELYSGLNSTYSWLLSIT
jgi:GDP-D-mannose 3',5'-epimerase